MASLYCLQKQRELRRMMDSVMQFEGTVYEGGYGLIAREVMKVDPKILHRNAKVIYSYICSYGAASNSSDRTAFPSVEIQCDHLGMTIDTYYKYRKQLITNGYLRITKVRDEGGKFEKNLYTILSFTAPQRDSEPHPKKSGMDKKPYPKKQGTAPHPNLSGTAKPYTAKRGTNSNSFNSNNFNNNNIKSINNSLSKEDIAIYETILDIYEFSEREIKDIIFRMNQKELSPTKNEIIAQCKHMKNVGDQVRMRAIYFVNGIEANLGRSLANKKRKKQMEEATVPFYDWLEEK
jgi:hypothetical protein